MVGFMKIFLSEILKRWTGSEMLFSRSVDECRKLKSTDECLSKRDFFCAIGRMKILTLIYTMYLLTNFNFNKALKALLFIFIAIALIIGMQK